MRIAIDVMGGDKAPTAILEGAFQSLESLSEDDQLVLVGNEQVIESAIESRGDTDPRLQVVGSTDDIGMQDSPIDAIRTKPDSSIVKMARLGGRKSDDPVDVIISAGNTGAVVGAAQMHMRRLPGVHRPGLAVSIPTFSGPVVFCDIGANPDPKAHHLWQYGIMAATFCKDIFGVEKPSVAQLNIGGEEMKGTEIVQQTRDLLQGTPDLNYIGYIEGRDLFERVADVVVTDGFVGNVVLKLFEGISASVFKIISKEMTQANPQLAESIQAAIQTIYKSHDYQETGGAPLLGVNGTCIILHGSSDARAIKNAILKSRSLVERRLNQTISERLTNLNTKVGVA